MIVLSGDANYDPQSSNCIKMIIFNKEKKEISGQTEHVWITFIERGFSDEVTERKKK